MDLEKRLSLADLRITHISTDQSSEIQEASPSIREEIDHLIRKKVAALKRLSETRHEWLTYREIQREKYRASYLGKHFREFRTDSGRILSDCTITGICHGGISLIHSHGTVRISVAELSIAEQDRFGIDSSLAAKVYEAERNNHFLHEEKVYRALAAQSSGQPARSTAESGNLRVREISPRSKITYPSLGFRQLGTTRPSSESSATVRPSSPHISANLPEIAPGTNFSSLEQEHAPPAPN